MFRGLRRSVLAGTLIALSAPALAVAPGSGPRIDASSLTALGKAGITKPLRKERQVAWGQSTPSAPWRAFTARRAGSWNAAWDTATGVPSRIWGEGVAAPGTVGNAALAEQFARQMLADHLELLAPGAALGDFELASNRSDGAIRTVAFYQRASGLRVVGGQVSFRFKADRLVVIGSEALPSVAATVAISAPRTRLGLPELNDRAKGALRMELGLPAAPVTPAGDEMILPLVGDNSVLGYRVVRPLTIDGGFDGRYLSYVDVATGAVIAVRQLNTYASGTVRYRAVDRYPGRTRVDRPAPRAYVSVAGGAQTTTSGGGVMWGSEGEVEVQTQAVGDLVNVVNKAASETPAIATMTIGPNGSVVWDATANPEEDAQVNAYIATGIVKEYVRALVDPSMPTLDEQMVVNVNIGQSCNAFFDGKAINFFQANDSCQNTALIEDVIYHEYGHRLHTAELIPGVGDFDGAMSEGASDFLAASITGDPGMGRGFFYLDTPLRELDPADMEWIWPRDIGEVHATGKIFGGIYWDLRKDLIEQLGASAGIPLVNKLYLGALRRAINIPSSLIESLLEDDNDGNLSNGTPHECAIRAAFGRHGIRTATGTVIAPGQLDVNARAIGVHVEVSGLSETCTGDEIASAEIQWIPGFGGIPQAGSAIATSAGPNKFFAQLPLSPQESVHYKAKVNFIDGSYLILADNFADPYYQLYQGETVKLYCTDFDTSNPFDDGWTTGTDSGDPSPFEWGVPSSVGSTDPHAAFSGTRVLGMSLGGSYLPEQRMWLASPPIDVGRYSDVRVQYRRWLAVEDSYFDKALVTANGKQAWMNLSAEAGDNSALHHVDKEWRFHDVALSGYFSGHELTVGWEITSDGGLELGGWHLNDVCIVANPNAICGDGVKTPTEQCDNGAANADVPNVCRTDCRYPKCGDNIIDEGEECDEGPMGDAVCSNKCLVLGPLDSGCCSSSRGGGPVSLTLGGLVGLLLLRRRRRR